LTKRKYISLANVYTTKNFKAAAQKIRMSFLPKELND
jgi:hypothetical protein